MLMNDPWLENNVPAILAEYRRQLEKQEEWSLKILVEHYGLEGHDKQSYIDALVEHYRKQLKDK
jgi:hypothetical protein